MPLFSCCHLVPRHACVRAGAREAVRFLPPLNVSEGEIEEALDIFAHSLEDVFGAASSAKAPLAAVA